MTDRQDSPDEQPPSGTVRLPGEMLEMARFISLYDKAAGGKRFRLNDIFIIACRDNLQAWYDRVHARVFGQEEEKPKGKRRKGEGK